MPFVKGRSGNPQGRRPGATGKRQRFVQDALDKYDFSPFEEKLKLAVSLRNILRRNHFDSPEARMAHIAQYDITLRDLMQYSCPKLKQVEHYAHIEIIQKLQALDEFDDAQLQALLDEVQELTSGAA